MNTQEDTFAKTEISLTQTLIKPKKDPLKEIDQSRQIVFLILGFALLLYGVVESSFREDIWTSILFSWFFYSFFISDLLDSRRRKRRAIFIKEYHFPSAIKKGIKKYYPHLSEDQLLLVLEGLRQYFQLCNSPYTSGMVSMPSRVVDVAWHEFTLLRRPYEEFCKNSLARFPHHIPAVAIVSSASIPEDLKAAWHRACEWENIDQKSPSRLPFLFAIDEALNISDGFKHSLASDYTFEDYPGI